MLAWHLGWLLTITALAILFAIGLVAAALALVPHSSTVLALTYLATCFLLLGVLFPWDTLTWLP